MGGTSGGTSGTFYIPYVNKFFFADKSDGYKSIDSNYAPLLSILVKMGGEAFSSFGELTI
jgi:hypothetical protein